MANYSNEPLTDAEERRRKELLNTQGGVGNLRKDLPPETIRAAIAARERMVGEGELRARRKAGTLGDDISETIGGIVGIDLPDPSVLQFTPVSLDKAQEQAERLTFDALKTVERVGLPLAIDFTRVSNKASEEAFEAVLDFVLPDNQRAIREEASDLALNLFRGKLPSDVSRRIMLQAAATSLNTGVPASSPFIRDIATADLAQGFLGGVTQAQDIVAFARQNFSPPYIDPGRLGLEMFANLSVPVQVALQNQQFNMQNEFNAMVTRYSAEMNNRTIAQQIHQSRLDRELQLEAAREQSRTSGLGLLGTIAGAAIGGLVPGGAGFNALGALVGGSIGSSVGTGIGGMIADSPQVQATSFGLSMQGLTGGLQGYAQIQAQQQAQTNFNRLIQAFQAPPATPQIANNPMPFGAALGFNPANVNPQQLQSVYQGVASLPGMGSFMNNFVQPATVNAISQVPFAGPVLPPTNLFNPGGNP